MCVWPPNPSVSLTHTHKITYTCKCNISSALAVQHFPLTLISKQPEGRIQSFLALLYHSEYVCKFDWLSLYICVCFIKLVTKFFTATKQSFSSPDKRESRPNRAIYGFNSPQDSNMTRPISEKQINGCLKVSGLIYRRASGQIKVIHTSAETISGVQALYSPVDKSCPNPPNYLGCFYFIWPSWAMQFFQLTPSTWSWKLSLSTYKTSSVTRFAFLLNCSDSDSLSWS